MFSSPNNRIPQLNVVAVVINKVTWLDARNFKDLCFEVDVFMAITADFKVKNLISKGYWTENSTFWFKLIV